MRWSTMTTVVHGILQAKILEWPAFLSPGDLPNSGTEPRSPALQADSLPAEPQEKPKSTGVGGLSLLQQIFPTQKSNWRLLHCRCILYQLSYQGSPRNEILMGMFIQVNALDNYGSVFYWTLPKFKKWQWCLYLFTINYRILWDFLSLYSSHIQCQILFYFLSF